MWHFPPLLVFAVLCVLCRDGSARPLFSLPLLIDNKFDFTFEFHYGESLASKVSGLIEGNALQRSNVTSSQLLQEMIVQLQDYCWFETPIESFDEDVSLRLIKIFAEGVDSNLVVNTVPTGYHPEMMDLIRKLYDQYAAVLHEVKNKMRHVAQSSTLKKAYDDIESELTVLFLLHFKPKHVYEFSPNAGWSTLYILNSLKYASSSDVVVKSYDLEDYCVDNVQDYFPMITNPGSRIKWVFTPGDVRSLFKSEFLTSQIDYLFIDSDHSRDFVKYYIDHLLEPLLIQTRASNSQVFVSVHDCVVNGQYPAEGEEMHNFLTKYDIPYFTPNNEFHQKELEDIRKSEWRFSTDPIHLQFRNPSIFFIFR